MTPKSTTLSMRRRNWKYQCCSRCWAHQESPRFKRDMKRRMAKHVRRTAVDFIETGLDRTPDTGLDFWEPTQGKWWTFGEETRTLPVTEWKQDQEWVRTSQKIDSYYRHLDVLISIKKTGGFSAEPCRMTCRCCWKAA